MRVTWCTVFSVMLTNIALGEPVAIDERPRAVEAERERAVANTPATAAGVRDAPQPGDESGRVDVDAGDGMGRRFGRAVLWIPRIPVELVAQPVRGLLYAQDRYRVAERLIAAFTTEDGRIAIFPTAFFETGFGLDAGARAYFADLISDEHLALRAGYGGTHRWVADLELARSFGAVTPSLELRAQGRDNESFYGIGNIDGTATGYRVVTMRARSRVRAQLPADLAVTASAALVDKDFDGFAEATQYLHGELQLAWDTRRRTSWWDAHGVRSGGGLVLGFAGYQHGLRDEPGFARVGIDLQRYVRLSEGPRVLELRAYGELVTAAPTTAPFAELPRLGGANLLRGYDSGQFRDRVATVVQVAYRWSAAAWLAPSVFVDAGRVHDGLREISLDGMRVGFGGALELYGRGGMTLRGQLATSIDGGIFVYLSLQPVFDMRTERY